MHSPKRSSRLFFLFLWTSLAIVPSLFAEVKLITPGGYLQGVPFLVRVEVRDNSGARDWNLWNAEAIFSTDQPGVSLSVSRVALRNGLGSALLTINGSVDFTLTATVNAERAVRLVRTLVGAPATSARGVLPGTSTTWSGVINVTSDVTVPSGHTLTIQPNTTVLINGVASGTTGVNLIVNGAIQSLGTEVNPVVITCSDANLNWGQIRHANSQASSYEYTFISKAGRAPGEGHTGTGPALRLNNSTLTLEGSVISDLTASGSTIGKIMMADGSNLTFRDCVLARARMGPEIAGTGLVCTNSCIMEMTGPDDADGIYLHTAAGRSIRISGCVIALGNDDAIDTLDSNVTVENCILRDWPNPNEDAKGVSVFNGEVSLRRCLIANCFAGVSAKSSGPLAVLRIDHCTITGIDHGVSAATKSNAAAGNINIYLTNSIVRSADALRSDFGPEKFVAVNYCALSEIWPGTGNTTADPLFVDAASGDYHLLSTSPCVDAGDPAFPPDPDGSRTDIGFFTTPSQPRSLSVNITAPAPEAVFKPPANITIAATATSTTSSVTRVEFFSGVTKLGEDATTPYSFAWNNVGAGSYILRAVATQSGGVTATSAPVNVSVTSAEAPSTNVLVAAGSDWKYLDNGTDPGATWRQLAFNDASWKSGRAQLGYGDGDEATVVGFGPNATSRYITTYFRRVFSVTEISSITQLTVRLLRDDGGVVYLNGTEIFRSNMPAGNITAATLASANAAPADETTNFFSQNVARTLLVEGQNVLAVEIHQANATSSDLSFDLALTAVRSTTAANAPPVVTITSPSNDAVFAEPASFTIAANATDPDGSVARVAFYANGAKLEEIASSPFNYVWNGVQSGSYALTAVATDASGLSTTSSVVDVLVTASAGPPGVANLFPPPGTVAALTEITVSFTEAVNGVNASDLLINGKPAVGVTGTGAGPYTFAFPQPAPGTVAVSWVASPGIRDQSNNAFAGGSWNYLLDPNQIGVVINEIMYHPASENPLEEFIELFNPSASTLNLRGWRIRDAVEFTFPDMTLPAGGYLVVVADLATFQKKYPGVANVVGNWTGILSNSREDIDLDDAQSHRVDSVRYADEGDWAVRQRGVLDRGHRGWVWTAEHDGLGKSLELINPRASNNNGQNWASSVAREGTPGKINSVHATNTPPFIENVAHFPIVPKSGQSVLVTANISRETAAGVTVTLSYRVDSASPPPFATVSMRDDGLNGDATAADGVFSAVVPGQPNNAVVEFYLSARDAQGNSRSWPAPVVAAPDGAGPVGQVANALYQVDDTEYSGTQPLYKITMTEAERAELQAIDDNINGAANSDAQMNATFVSIDGTGTELRYLAGVRNRGHGTRTAKPNNYRVNFRSDAVWKGATALNVNAQFTWLQVLGAALNTQAGIAGAHSRAVQLRVNNANLAFVSGNDRTYSSYAANEAINADWADRHFPDDGEGNVYRALRDLVPSDFDYRTLAAYPGLKGPETKNSYTNTWFKTTNASEDDWTDLIAMLRVFGLNGTEPFTPENVRKVINVEQWLRHLAVMNLLGNSETGLNSGYNDDYFIYRGVKDRRFILTYYDLDQILGFNGSFGANSSLFSAANAGNLQRSGPAFGRFLHQPEFEPIYYAALKELIETTFSAPQFNALVDQVLGGFVPDLTRSQLKSWMDARRAYVLSQLPAVQVAKPPVATVSGVPRSPTFRATATLHVGGSGVTHYRFSLNGGAFGAETLVDTPMVLLGLGNGTNAVAVIGRNASGTFQEPANATTVSWVVNPAWPAVRLNEVIASRSGDLCDQIELYNEGASAVNLAGLRLTDDPRRPNAFAFGSATLAPGAFLVLDSGQLGFSLDASGDGVYLFNSVANGGALLDSVQFGPQITDFSIGRVGESGEWQLTQPTFGAANTIQPLGDIRQIKINEWLASGVSPYPDDFVELLNPNPLPVALGGSYLTDQPVGAPTRSQIASLSFIPAQGYAVFTSGNGNRTTEINFDLASEQGEIALFAPDLSPIDSVVYGPQRTGVSAGRCPDGDLSQKPLETPTPGGPNQCPFVPLPPQAIALIPFNHVWKYDASGTNLGSAWKEIKFDDSAWRAGPGLLGFETARLAEPILTAIPNAVGIVTFYFRASFRVDPALTPSSFQITYLVDDGAAFYLNGQEIGPRYNLPATANYQTFASSTVEATAQTLAIAPNQFRPGTNWIAVEVHQVNRTSSDMVFGLKLDALIVTNSAAQAGVLINEVLANNATLAEPDGSKPDWLELYNPSSVTVDLAGMSLTDDVANPRRWIFPSGSLLPAKGFLKVRFDPAAPASGANTAFGLNANGGAVFLFNRPADGGGLQSAVTYGLQAADWSIGRVPDGGTNWTLNIPTLGAPNRAASLGNPQTLKINEWMADPASGGDWFEIFNPNPEPVELSRLWLSDNLTDRTKQPLPPLSFIGNGPHGFLKFEADENADAGADHVNFKLSASGESLAISTAGGVLIDGLSFGPQLRGVSEGRLPDGSANIVSFAASPSPGSGNFLPLGSVVINELLSHSDPPLMDAVELHNPSAAAVDLSGWFLSDSAFNLRKFQIPTGTVIPPGGYFVFYEDQFNAADGANEPFSFSSVHGDAVYLSQAVNGALTGYRAAATFGPAENGISFGRFPTSQGFHFVAMAQPTLGKDNPATTNEFKLGTGAMNAYAKVGPVIITEIMYHPAGTNDALEFVELRNASPTAAPLFDPANPANTWRLRKGIEFDFPQAISIPAGGYLVVVGFDPQSDTAALAAFQSVYGSSATLVGPYKGKLDNGGDAIELQKPDPPQTLPGPDFGLVPYIVVDRIDYSDISPWPVSADGTGQSLQKTNDLLYGNDPVNWIAAAPNPGRAGAAVGDADHDGLPDDWEVANGLNPNDPADAATDSDGDGMSNLQEYLAGTNPRSAASALRATVRLNSGGQLVLEFDAAANRAYTIESRESLAAGAWANFMDVSAAPSERILQLPIPNNGSTRFLRIVLSQRVGP